MAVVATVMGPGGVAALKAAFMGTSLASLEALAAFAGKVALGYAYSALTAANRINPPIQSYDINQLGSALPTAQIYGETKVGGVIFYQETTNDGDFLHRFIAFADHEIQSFEEIYVDEFKVTLNSSTGVVTTAIDLDGETVDRFNTASGESVVCQIKEKLGTTIQAYSPIESSPVWDESHTASGIAYLHCTFFFDQDAYTMGAPNITAVIKGKKVYDPRDGSTAYSANSALCLRDYLITSGVATSDEIDETAFTVAANICDENVTLVSGSTEKRYSCNGSFISDATPQTVIGAIVDTMAGMVWYSQGKWQCKAAKYTTPVLSLTEDDFRSGLSISTRNSRKEGFNKVTGLFRGEETNWQDANFPSISSPTFLNVDGGQESTLEMSLPFVSSSATAQRIAKLALYRNREQVQISGSFGMRCLNLTVGDLVTITYPRLGFSSKVFEVVEWTFGLSSDMTLQVSMALQEISEGVFRWDADETAFESNNTTLRKPFFLPSIGLSHTTSEIEYNEKITTTLFVTVASPHPNQIDSVEVRLKRTTKGESDVNIMSIIVSFLRIITSIATAGELSLWQTGTPQYFGNVDDAGTENISISDVVVLLRVEVGLDNTTAQEDYINNTFIPTMLANPEKYQGYVSVAPYQEEFVTVNKGNLGLYEFKDIEEGDYRVRARAVNSHGSKGVWVE